MDVLPLLLRCLRNRRTAAAMTIRRRQYDVPLLPPRIGVARANPAVVRRQEEAAKARVGAR